MFEACSLLVVYQVIVRAGNRPNVDTRAAVLDGPAVDAPCSRRAMSALRVTSLVDL